VPSTPPPLVRDPFRLGALAAGLAAGVSAAAVAACAGWVHSTARGHLFTEDAVPPRPVALILGAQVYPDGTPAPFLAARLDLGRRLYEAGRVRALLVSGDAMAPEYDEPVAMRNYLLAAGVPAEKVIADPAGFDTYDSCARARRIYGVTAVILVTQGYHLPRAVATARALGLDAVGAGDDTVDPRSPAWRRGAVRDQVACVKTVIDLLSRRDPALGAPDGRVSRALAE
jgi:vancomycin permeability regulator SanA